MLFFAWTSFIFLLEFAYNLFTMKKHFHTFYFLGFAYLSICGQIVVLPRFSKRPWFFWSQFLFLNPVKLSVRFSYLVFNEHSFCRRTIVLLWWRWRESNPWPPACRAGALPAELHPHIRDTVPENRTTNRSYETLSRRFCFLCELREILFQFLMFSIERRWSSRTFRYGYLVTT